MAQVAWNMCKISPIGVLAVLTLSSRYVSATHTSDNQTKTDGTAAQSSKEPLDQGMQFLYVLTNGFLDTVRPSGLSSNQIEDLGIRVGQGNNSDIGVNPAVIESKDYWQQVIRTFPGVTACVIVGLLYFLVMPIAGLIFCCCRFCCKKCGADPHHKEGKYDKCWRGCGGFTLCVLATVALTAAVCTFLSNEILRQRSSDGNRGALHSIEIGLVDAEMYKDSTLSTLEKGLINAFDISRDQLIAKLRGSPEKAERAIGQFTNATRIIAAAEALAQNLDEIRGHLQGINNSVNYLRDNQMELESELNTVRQKIIQTVDSCGEQQCLAVKYRAGNLTIQADYTRVDDVSSQLTKVDGIIGRNISALIESGKQEFDSISNRIRDDTNNKINEIITEVETEVDSAKNDALYNYNKIKDQINSVFGGLTQKSEELKSDWQPYVTKYGDYRWYGGIAIGCILVIVVILYYVGLCFGCGGEPAYEDSRTCNRGTGSVMLLCGVLMTLVLAWVLMLLVTILFLVGGMVHTEACRPLVNNLTDPNNVALKIASSFLNSSANFDLDISYGLSACKQDAAIYEAAQLEKTYNLTQVLNIDNYGVRDKIDELKSIVVEIKDVNILQNDTRQELINLANAGLEQIDFQSFTNELAKQLTTENLTALAGDLDETADNLSASPGTGTVASNLRNHANDLRNIESTRVQPMALETGKLTVAVNNLENLLSDTAGQKNFRNYTHELIAEFDQAAQNIKVNGSQEITKFVSNLAEELYTDLKNDAEAILVEVKTNMGRCRPLYDAAKRIINVACVDILYPFNGFWFSLATCLGLFLPCLFIACCLSTLYRKTEEFSGDKSFDDPRYTWMREQQSSLLDHQYPNCY